MIYNKILRVFKEKFAAVPLVVKSPGRVNIIGEHTDYNEGFVLPAAIDKAIYVAVSKRNDQTIHLYSIDYLQDYMVQTNEVAPTKTWTTYILGVVKQLQLEGFETGGFNLVIDGDVPIGAGLSSSAAVECATVYALNELFGFRIDKMQMIRIAQQAEHRFSGVKCGIMDMFASMFGKKDHVIRLDCRSMAYEYKPLQLDGYKLVLLNTNIRHSLASSAYNERRQQCEQGVAWIRAYQPQVSSLRDATMDMLDQYVLPKDKLVYQRCSYVVAEKQRLLDGFAGLENGDIAFLGKKMFETHEGLSKLYEVSCKELDFMVDSVKHNPDVLGARMMGGGFGGCTINIVKEKGIDELIEKLNLQYKRHHYKELTAYVVGIENGTSLVKPYTAVPV